MVGGIGSFKTDRRVLTPGSMYPYAPVLFDYVRRAMPMNAPQSLSNDEAYAVTGYVLQLNGLVAADAVMTAASLTAVQMPNRNGFMVDDRPDTAATRCMSQCTPIAGK
jgi:cytochrome c